MQFSSFSTSFGKGNSYRGFEDLVKYVNNLGKGFMKGQKGGGEFILDKSMIRNYNKENTKGFIKFKRKGYQNKDFLTDLMKQELDGVQTLLLI